MRGCTLKTRNLCIVVCILANISPIIGNKIVALRRRSTKNTNYLVRCTRRFTPGLCIEPVIPVWTFVFQQQNCTERYGCKQDWRTNRFTTYARCMQRCQQLIHFYTEVLARDPFNLSAYIRAQSWSRRDLGGDDDGLENEEEPDDIIGKNLNGPASRLLDESVDHNDWAVTVDIDDVHVESRENDGLIDYDYFHQ